MSDSALPSCPPDASTGTAAHHGLTVVAAIGAVVLSLLVLYAVLLDQGALLEPALGAVATQANYLHEFAHDGRHLLGAPCH